MIFIRFQNPKSDLRQKDKPDLGFCHFGFLAVAGDRSQKSNILMLAIRAQRASGTGRQRAMRDCFTGLCHPGVCRAGILYRARSRLDRSRYFQVNTYLKALTDICTMPSIALLSNLDLYLINLRSSYSLCQSRALCALFSLLPSLAALMRSACFFAGALFFARMTLSKALFMVFRLDSSCAKELIV